MKDFIERLENLDGPCRECDAEIAIASGVFVPSENWARTGAQTWHLNIRDEGPIRSWDDCFQPKPYSSSIDAALTLIPDGWEPRKASFYEQAVTFSIVKPAGKITIIAGAHKLFAIAICVAALRARQSIIDGER